MPHTMPQDDPSLFSVLKKSIGKDLSTITLPAAYNEPLSLLQRLAEDLEYIHLIEQAAATEEPYDRLALVAAFAISAYACTRYRSKKPFNPLLGETFQDKRFNFVAEKCCHHPPILACHAHGNDWEYWATCEAQNKLGATSLEIIPLGWTHLKIQDDHYRWDKPSSLLRNIMSTQRCYLEHVGRMTIENSRTGDYVDVDFKEAPFWKMNAVNTTITGTLYASNGEPRGSLSGNWDSSLSYTSHTSLEIRKIWNAHPYPSKASECYGLTAFGYTLNEITPQLEEEILPTDSRRRPDQRLLENGSWKEAEKEKQRLEEAQRDRRQRGVSRKPIWFRKVSEEADGESQEWQYIGGISENKGQRVAEGDTNIPEPLW